MFRPTWLTGERLLWTSLIQVFDSVPSARYVLTVFKEYISLFDFRTL